MNIECSEAVGLSYTMEGKRLWLRIQTIELEIGYLLDLWHLLALLGVTATFGGGMLPIVKYKN